jgi:hypothetical protein
MSLIWGLTRNYMYARIALYMLPRLHRYMRARIAWYMCWSHKDATHRIARARPWRCRRWSTLRPRREDPRKDTRNTKSCYVSQFSALEANPVQNDHKIMATLKLSHASRSRHGVGATWQGSLDGVAVAGLPAQNQFSLYCQPSKRVVGSLRLLFA